MDRIEHVPDLSATSLAYLSKIQAGIDCQSTFLRRKKLAKKWFENRKNNKTFAEIKEKLKAMSPSGTRCVYCQSNELYAIEHFRPKAHFPECAFVWENYLYICEHCNLKKSDEFCVYYPADSKSAWYHFPTKTNAEVPQEVRNRMPALLNPRCEDPLAYLMLDLIDTFNFLPRHPPGTTEHYRAQYTIDQLELNKRDSLTRYREQAFDNYYSYLKNYISGDPEGRCKIAKMSHTAVWREMQRQSHKKNTELNELFGKAPEAREW